MHRGWVNLKSALTGRDDHAILAECERGEDSAVRSYQDALAHDLPSDVRSSVEEQYRQVLEAHNRVKSLRDSSQMDFGAEHRSDVRETTRDVADDVRVGTRRVGDDIREGVDDVRDDVTSDRPLRNRNY